MDLCPEISAVYDKLSKYLSDITFDLPDVELAVVFSLNNALNDIKMKSRESSVLKTLESVIDIVWEDLNTGHWSQVPDCKRKVYAIASFFKVVRILQEEVSAGSFSCDRLKEGVKTADMGLMMGNYLRQELSEAAHLLNDLLVKGTSSVANYTLETPNEDISRLAIPGARGQLVPSLKCPSLESFHKNFFTIKQPVKLTDCISHWPALKKWSNVNYLINTAGSRTVPIELGSSYTQNDWSMKLISFEEFIKLYVIKNNDSMGYLAQHQLFDQVPELKNDILTPEYCCLSDCEESSCNVDINAWFGPCGTVSPLHYDPKHNLLAQVIGRKRILLYNPAESELLYPHEGFMLHNTAQVDPETPEYLEFPKYKSAKPLECHLYPGEILYIPPKWWHHVRSLDVSISVSFWWE